MKRYIRANSSALNFRWTKPWRPYSGSTSSYQTLYVNDVEVGYVESYDVDGEFGSIAYIKADPNEYEQSLGTFKSSAEARNRLEQEVRRANDLIESFPDNQNVDSATQVFAESDEDRWYNVSWYTQDGRQNGENVLVPAHSSYDPYVYIERYLIGTYGDEYGGIADYMEVDSTLPDGSVWDEGYEPIESDTIIKRYSDVRPYEDRKYWYFTTHGIGPGTTPKDLTVLETREGQNEKGTWGTFVCLDGVLNTDELSYYDLKELAPDNITSAEDIEDNEDEWSPYHGHNYMVCAGPYNELTFHCDDPKRAITYWFKYNKKYPTEVAVMCPTKDLAMQLVKAGTPKLLTSLEEKFGCPYKLDWLIDECKRKSEDGCKGFYEGEYGDTVHPFGVG